MLTIATMQSDVGTDIRANGRRIRADMLKAAQAGARLAHFPEGALSGYIGTEIEDWATVDWAGLRQELDETAALARRLGLWVVLGANHRLGHRLRPWPQNSLYVISDTGVLAGRYAKRLLSNSEHTYWYSPGADPLVFDVDGIRFGCALCIEVVFPHLFTEYERLGVHCMLLSAYSSDPVHGVMARAHAATNGMWLSLSTPTKCSAGLPSQLFGPDGHVIGTAPDGAPAMLVHPLDPADGRYRVALHVARPWRAHARTRADARPRSAQPRRPGDQRSGK